MRQGGEKYRDLGASRAGTEHFWQQRLTGIVNFFLGLTVILSLTFYGRGDHAEVLAWFAQPWLAALLIAFVISASWHMRLGANVIIDDYIHTEGLRLFFHLLNIFISLAVMLVGILSLLQILLGDVSAVDLSLDSAPMPEDQTSPPTQEQSP